MIRLLYSSIILMACIMLSGCGAAVVGGAAYGGYKGATDQRTIGTMFDDSVLATKVKSKMISDEFVKARHVDVDVLNGVVYLIGVVESESQKRMAADIARGVDGVRDVENQLIVGSTSAGQVLNDTILSSKIKAELIKASGVRSNNIDVDTINNRVTLTGMLKSQAQKDTVLSIVQKVAGDRQIVDNLTINN